MSSTRFRHTLWTLVALAAGIIACGGEKGPTQPAAPTKVIFTVQPTNVGAGVAIASAVQVAIQDASGNTVSSATNAVTMALGANPGAGTLSGTLTVAATQGIATFSNLRIDRLGSGYTLAASAGGRPRATSIPFAGPVALTPVLVAGGVSFAAVSAGSFRSTCGLTAAGAAYCWGDNSNGQLGDGTTTDRSSPVLVAGGVSFAAVSTGDAHNCGVTAAGAAY